MDCNKRDNDTSPPETFFCIACCFFLDGFIVGRNSADALAVEESPPTDGNAALDDSGGVLLKPLLILELPSCESSLLSLASSLNCGVDTLSLPVADDDVLLRVGVLVKA